MYAQIIKGLKTTNLCGGCLQLNFCLGPQQFMGRLHRATVCHFTLFSNRNFMSMKAACKLDLVIVTRLCIVESSGMKHIQYRCYVDFFSLNR